MLFDRLPVVNFQVKTTSPDVYRVKPHTGILAVKDRIVITIVLPSGKELLSIFLYTETA